MKRIGAALGLAAVLLGAQAAAPSYELRRQALASLVKVRATDCPDGDRAASGFVLERGERIVTAHHAVGGCRQVVVSFEGAEKDKLRPARIVRVHAAGDLALLEVAAAPAAARPLRMAAAAPDPDSIFAGLGYALNMPSASDIEVRFAVGARRLRDILPPEAATELERNRSRIATDREVLRFNVALQPGMSGGPIIDASGAVIGVVAGGLKAGAAPASWGWPSESVRLLLASTEPVDQVVTPARTHYTLQDFNAVSAALAANRSLRCGDLDFVDTGTRSLAELMRGADDWPRVQHLISISREDPALLANERFQVWLHRASGATAIVPAGYALRAEGRVCVARSSQGPFEQVVFGTPAPGQVSVFAASKQYEEQLALARLIPWQFLQFDVQLTTAALNPITGQMEPSTLGQPTGLMFARKGVIMRRPEGLGHAFSTLVARSDTFLGVSTLNRVQHPGLANCPLPATPNAYCAGAMAHLREWTRFVLATQLSTYPSY